MAGRPTIFTQELFDDICEIIANSERGLVSICKDKGLNASTFYDWVAKEVELANKYARAKDLQGEFMAERILTIADDKTGDVLAGEFGEVGNSANVSRSKLQVDSRKWLASKLLPKKYGDKVQTELSGSLEVKQITGMEIK